MFFSFPRLINYFRSDGAQLLSCKLDQFCLKTRQLQKRISQASKQALMLLASTLREGWNYLSKRRSRDFEELRQSPPDQTLLDEKKRDVKISPIHSLPTDVWQIIMDQCDRSSRSNSSQVCKDLDKTNRFMKSTLYSSDLKDDLPNRYPNLTSFSLLVDTKIPLEKFKILLGCKYLKKLDLSKIDLIDDRVLFTLKNSIILETLILANCRNITDGGLHCLHGSPLEYSLRYLDLSQCSQITDLGIRYLGNGALEKLKLQHCTQICGWGLNAFVDRIPQSLQHLNLNYNQCLSLGTLQDKFNERSYHHFLDIRSLRKLCLSASDVDGAVVEHIAKNLTNLTYLDLSSCQNISCQELMPITTLTNLQSLTLASCRVYNSFASNLTALTNLQELDLSACAIINRKCADVFPKLPKLQELHLNGCSNSLVDSVLALLKNENKKQKTIVHFLLTHPNVPNLSSDPFVVSKTAELGNIDSWS